MDKLEEHIRKNREGMDCYTPASGIWKRINRELPKEKRSLRHRLSIAAMITVILGSAIVFFKPGSILSDTSKEPSYDTGMEYTNPQLNETEIYYNNLVNSLYTEATPLLTGNPEIRKELKTDISHIDSICLEIKKDLKDNVANQEVVEALIQNYRIKIRLLEDMLILLKEDDKNQDKSKSNEL